MLAKLITNVSQALYRTEENSGTSIPQFSLAQDGQRFSLAIAPRAPPSRAEVTFPPLLPAPGFPVLLVPAHPTRANEIPKMKPPRPQFVVPQFGGQGSQGTIEGDPARLDLLRHRVIPTAPIGLVSPLSQDFFPDGTCINEEEVTGTMNSGSYFSNLMSNEFSYPAVHATTAAGLPDDTPPPAVYAAATTGLPDDTPPPDQAATQQNAPAVVKDKGRNKNFSVDEDTLLVSAWLNVSLDGIQGADQPRIKYWSRIHAYFHAHKKFESDRSPGSLMNRWSGIQHDVNVFAGCLSKIEARNGGWSVDDKVASACTMFKADDKLHKNSLYALLEDTKGQAQVDGEAKSHECSKTGRKKAENYSQFEPFIGSTFNHS